MSKNDSNSFQLYELCNEFYKYEEHLLTGEKDKKNICYLIDSKSIDNLKKQINYDKFKKYIKNNLSEEEFKGKVKGFKIKNKIDLSAETFKTGDDLIKSLNNGNQYYYITESLCSKICKKKNFENRGIYYLFHKSTIKFIFDDNNSIKFLNKLSGLIEISLLVKDDQISNNNERDNLNYRKNEKYPKDKDKYDFKNDLEILIRLFYYNKFMKERDNFQFKILKQENKQSVYLINNDWLEKYKFFYDYNELENYLFQNKNAIYALDFITDESIQKIISTLPPPYVKKLENKRKFDKKFTKYDTDKIITKKNGIIREFSYLKNYQIINKKIHDALINAEYETSEESLKNCNLYFIGNNKIILLFKSDIINDNNEMGYINDKNIFIPEFVLHLEDNNILIPYLNKFLTNFSSFSSNQENKCFEIRDEKNSLIGTCFRIEQNKIDNESKNLNQSNEIETNKAPLDNSEINIQKHIELFLEFYLFYEEMNEKIKRSLFKSKREEFYIIKKKWTNKIMEYFEYNKFIDKIKKGHINQIIDKYKIDKNYSDFLVSIMKLLSNDYKKVINAKIKDKNELKIFSNVQLYNIKLKNKEIQKNKPTYYYYSNIDIINEKIFRLIKEIFKLESQEEKREFLIGDDKIIMDFNLKLKTQISLIVGDYKNNNLEPDILFVFDNKEYLNNFYERFKLKGYIKTIENLKMNDILYDEQSKKRIGYIYDINYLNDLQITDTQQNLSSLKTNPISNNNESATSNASSSGTKVIKNENESYISSEKNEIIQLNYFFKNQIKSLISYYYFIKDLKNNILHNILFNKQQTQVFFGMGKAYLIDENWMNLFKKTFLYQDLIIQIKQIQIKYSINEPKNNIKKIYDKLDIEYINNLKNKEKERPEELLKNLSSYTDNFIEKYKDKNILIYSCNYDILNPEAFQQMNKTPGNEILSILKDKERDYLINSGKLIIKIESISLNRYELLIGNFNNEKEKFIPELLFKYESRDLMINHFEKLKQNSFNSFTKSYVTLNGNDLTLEINGTKTIQIIGTIYKLKDVNWKEEKLNQVKENINIKKEKEKGKVKEKAKIQETQLFLSDIQKFHIKFLYSLHLFYEDLVKEINGYKITKSLIKDGYIVNHQVIVDFKKFYYYDEIKNLFKKENIIDNIIESFQNDYIKKVQKQKEKKPKKEELFKIQIEKYNNLDLKYFLNSTILDFNTIKVLFPGNYFENKPEIEKIFYFIKDKKIILKYGLVINIGIFLVNNIFKSEILILCSDKENINFILDYIKNSSIYNFVNQGSIEQKNFVKYNWNNIILFINKKYIPQNNNVDNKEEHYNKNAQKENYKNEGKQKFNENNFDNLKINNEKIKNTIENETNKANEILKDYYSQYRISTQYQQLKKNDLTKNQNSQFYYNDENSSKNQDSNKQQNIKKNERQKNQLNQEIQNNLQNLEEAKRKEEIRQKENQLEKLIYIMIDLEKTNMKIKTHLNKFTNLENYYLINLNWINEYLKIKETYNFFYNDTIRNKIKSTIQNDLNISDEQLLKLLKSDGDLKQSIDYTTNDLKIINSPNQFPIEPEIIKTKQFVYFSNFILINAKTINKCFKLDKKITPFDCLLGDNLVIILFNNNNALMYDLKEEKFLIKMFFYFNEKRHLKESIELLKENHLEIYKQYYTLFHEDNVSPIFNKNNDEVGTVFLFDYRITDYSPYMISEELKALIILFFNYIRINLKNNKERNGKYFLINPEFINAFKNHYNYAELEKRLCKIKLVKDIFNNIKNGFNNFHDVLNDKNICIIIKQFIWDINQDSIKKGLLKTNIEPEPIIEEIQGKSYFYYKRFELINDRIYEILINNEIIAPNLRQRYCTFENDYIYFEVPGDFCHNNNPRNIEICISNNDNSF